MKYKNWPKKTAENTLKTLC